MIGTHTQVRSVCGWPAPRRGVLVFKRPKHLMYTKRDKALRATRLVSDCDMVSTSLMFSHQADLQGMLLLRSSHTHSGRLCGTKATAPIDAVEARLKGFFCRLL
ncbi:unnamed protein product [Pleuronectes platessa]|uniref:Uncharacterized protein n=1 Tax=Pleuronectes platessa TaxID=8262 RepID=A0A9N7V9V3_PLEPL|nr:unnamed protein product [Pleuronectes platessa]